MSRRRSGILIGAIIMLIMGVIALTREAAAAQNVNLSSNYPYVQKMLLTSVAKCIQSYNVVATEVDTQFYDTSHPGILNNMFSTAATTQVPLPSFATDLAVSSTSCYNLFTGDGLFVGQAGTFPGVMGIFGINNMSLPDQLALFGFEPKNTGANSSTRRVEFTDGNGHVKYSDSVVVDTSSGKVVATPQNEFSGNCSAISYDNIVSVQTAGDKYRVVVNPAICQYHEGNYVGMSLDAGALGNYQALTLNGEEFEAGNSADEFYANMMQAIYNMLGGVTLKYDSTNAGNFISSETGGVMRNFSVNYAMQENTVEVAQDNIWERTTSNTITALNVVQRLSNGTYNLGNLTFTPEEALKYYVAELTEHYFAGQNINDYWKCDDNIAAAGNRVEISLMPTTGRSTLNLARPESSQTCKLYTSYSDNSTEELNGFSEPMTDMEGETTLNFKNSRKLNLTTLISAINQLVDIVLPNAGDSIAVDTSGIIASTDGSLSQNANTCLSQGGFLSLSWIGCTIVEWAVGMVDGLYTNALEPRLSVNPVILTGVNGNNGAYEAWGTFRNFANLAFIIVLLVVIFSQLTGVGIDNYGIKRILPKMIVSAVLVNLSFFLCELCVDVSNIVGNGMQVLFENLSSSLAINNDAYRDAAGAAAISGVGLITTVVAFISWADLAMVMGLLVTAIGTVVSIVFIFVLLSAREAAIVVLIAIAPLALVCYMLPNTKRLFDQWLKMMEGLLLVYPICGLLIGGGSYVSKLLLAAGVTDFFGVLTAILVSVVPLFFIPNVLRGAFSAMGNLGAQISGFGQRIRGGVERGVRSSRPFKTAEQSLQFRSQIRSREAEARRAERTRTSLLARAGGNRENLSVIDQARLTEAERIVSEHAGQRGKERAGEAVLTEDYARADAQDSRNRRQAEIDAGKVVTPYDYARRQADNEVMLRGQAVRDEFIEPAISQDIAYSRAQSQFEARELKNHAERTASFSKPQMEQELQDAVRAFASDRNNVANRLRLQSAISEMEKRGMHKEMLDQRNGLTGLSLASSRASDTAIVGQLAQSKDLVLSQYGKTRGKNENTGMSLEAFTQLTNNGTDNLTAALAAKGPGVLGTASDDDLEFIAARNNGAAATTEMLVRKAAGTEDQKELDQINKILQNRNGQPDAYQMTVEQLGKMSLGTLNSMNVSVYNKALTELRNNPNSSANRRIINGMNQDVRAHLGL